MKTYDPGTFQFGCELEISDVRRDPLPAHLGTWDGCERDIVNTWPPYQYVAADPLGLEPPVGGEVNTRPTVGWQSQIDLVDEILTCFRQRGELPAAGCTSHFHVHIHVPGLTEDIDALKRLASYTYDNQEDIVRICGRYVEYPDMDAKARRYFHRDGGLMMPAYILKNIQELATDFPSFIRMFYTSKDGLRLGRPFRHAVNLYCLKHTQTIEFRMFRGTMNTSLLANCFRAAAMFVEHGLNGGPRFVNSGWFSRPVAPEDFPPMQWSKEQWDGLQRTKYPEGRGKKNRRHIPINPT